MASSTSDLDQILSDCYSFGICNVPSFDLTKTSVLQSTILDIKHDIIVSTLIGRDQDTLKRGYLDKVRQILVNNDALSALFLMDLIVKRQLRNPGISRYEQNTIRFDYEGKRYNLKCHPIANSDSESTILTKMQSSVVSLLSSPNIDDPVMQSLQRLFQDKKISNIQFGCGLDGKIETVSLTYCAINTLYTVTNGEQLEQLLRLIDNTGEKITIPLAMPSTGPKKPNIALHRSSVRGLYEVTNYNCQRMFFEPDLKSQVRGAYHIAGYTDEPLELTRKIDFDQLAKDHPKTWMMVLGWELAKLSNIDDMWFVLCYKSDDDPILDFYHYYIEKRDP